MDSTLIPAPQAELVVEDILVADSEMATEQTSLPVTQAEETVAENPTHDLPQVMESGSGTEGNNLTSPDLNLVGEAPVIVGMGPVEAKHFSLFLVLFSFLISFLKGSFFFIGSLIPQKRTAKPSHPDKPSATRQRVDEGNTSQHSGSFDFMNSVSRFLEGPNHDFHEVIIAIHLT